MRDPTCTVQCSTVQYSTVHAGPHPPHELDTHQVAAWAVVTHVVASYQRGSVLYVEFIFIVKLFSLQLSNTCIFNQRQRLPDLVIVSDEAAADTCDTCPHHLGVVARAGGVPAVRILRDTFNNRGRVVSS